MTNTIALGLGREESLGPVGDRGGRVTGLQHGADELPLV